MTATKRPQTELSVAASMDVLGDRQLSRDQVLDIGALGRTVPNVNVAQFGDGQYRLIWQTTAGLRLADEQQKYDFVLSKGGALMHASQSYPAVQPKFALSYLPDKNSQIYASVTRGFRAGAVFVSNAVQDPGDPSYKQEGTWQYELGYKSLLDDGHLQLQASAFYIDWNNLQVQRSILSVSPPGIFTVVDNATSARSYGAEGEVSWLPIEGLQVCAKGGYTNARYLDFHPTPALDYSGNRIEEVPDFFGRRGLRLSNGDGIGACVGHHALRLDGI
ncbi:MAG: TonB-dependent receptor [Rhizomicrobium sp.]